MHMLKVFHDESQTPMVLKLIAPLKINMEPEYDGLEDHFPFQTGDF